MSELVAFLAGTAVGALGLIPFLHTNTLVELLPRFLESGPAAVFVVSLAFSHAVFEVLPATFFAVPSASQNISVLPAHRLAREGKGFQAMKLMAYSLAAGVFFGVLASPAATFLLPLAYSLVKPVTALLLCGVVAVMLAGEKNFFAGLIVACLSGLLGLASFGLPLPEPVFPLLAGLFAVPAALAGARASELVEQSAGEPRVPWAMVLLGAFLGACSGLLPALSPALLAGIAFVFVKSGSEKFIALASSIAGAKLVSDLIVLGELGKARSGAAAAVQSFLGVPSATETTLLVVAGAAALAAALAALLLVYRRAALALCGKNYAFSSKVFLSFLAVMLFFFGGWLALFVCAVAACVGVLALLLNCKRSLCCAALLVPAIAALI
ncbi:MAG: tripartite tricarboxylate transporter permease [Candidatus Micrarchaeia archaeon]